MAKQNYKVTKLEEIDFDKHKHAQDFKPRGGGEKLRAVEMEDDFEIVLPDYFEAGVRVGYGGTVRGKKGDYLCKKANGEVFAVKGQLRGSELPGGGQLMVERFEKA